MISEKNIKAIDDAKNSYLFFNQLFGSTEKTAHI